MPSIFRIGLLAAAFVLFSIIKERIESGDVLYFAANGLSQYGVTGRPIHRYVSGEAIRRLVNKQTHLSHTRLIIQYHARANVAEFTVPIARVATAPRSEPSPAPP
jgi:hypothetical protein